MGCAVRGAPIPIQPWAWVLAGAVVAVAAASRLMGLGELSLTTDEGYTWNITQTSWSSLIFAATDVHPPLYDSLVKSLLPVGEAEWLLRLPSALLGIGGGGRAWLTVAALMILAIAPSRETADTIRPVAEEAIR